MINKTSLNVLKVLVSKGVFEDIYDGVNTIISLVPYPGVMQAYFETINVSNITFSGNSKSLEFNPVKVKLISEPQIDQAKASPTHISQYESAKQAILDLDV
jgi:hypothetical protein